MKMKIETIKSIILVVLIMLSLLLTLGIWRYQPDYQYADSGRSVIEGDLGGGKESKRSVILPSQIIYHQEGKALGLLDKAKERQLYEKIQNWSFYDFAVISLKSEENAINRENVVEIVFPTKLPTTIIQDVFTVDGESLIPENTFNRVYITLDKSQVDNQVIFENTDSGFSIGANIQNITEVHQILLGFKEEYEFMSYLTYENTNLVPVYIPEEVKMYKRLFSFKKIPITPLRNILFFDPSAVRSSGYTDGSRLYTDGSRAMIVHDNHIEFTIPPPSKTLPIKGQQLISQTIDFINKHSGWTSDINEQYQLYNLNERLNTVVYQLTYDGYPVFKKKELSTISVTMRNQNVYQYIRPLIQLKDTFGDGQEQAIKSGSEIITLLEKDKRFEMKTIIDVTVGYKIEEQQGGQIFTLTPTWYIKDYSGWKELESNIPINRGGENSAMGSD